MKNGYIFIYTSGETSHGQQSAVVSTVTWIICNWQTVTILGSVICVAHPEPRQHWHKVLLNITRLAFPITTGNNTFIYMYIPKIMNQIMKVLN